MAAIKKGLESPFFIAAILSPEKYMRNISHTSEKVLTSSVIGNIFPIHRERIKQQ